MIARVVKCRHKDGNDKPQTNERGKRDGVGTIRAKRAQRAASSLELAGSPSLFIQSFPLWRLAVFEQAAAGGGPAIRAERSQFRDQPPSREVTASHRRSRLHLREFAKNSRILAAFAPGANRAPQFFIPRKSGSHNSTGIRCADTPSTKGDSRL